MTGILAKESALPNLKSLLFVSMLTFAKLLNIIPEKVINILKT